MTASPDGAGPERHGDGPQPPPVPRWVKVSLLVAAALVGLLAAAMMLAGGDHGPGRHVGIGLVTSRVTTGGGGA